MNSTCSPRPALSLSDQQHLIDKLEVFKIQGRDKSGRHVLRIIGKFFPARDVSTEAVIKYLNAKIFPKIGERPFSVVYVHTDVHRRDNLPGISILRSINEAVPTSIKDHLQAVYFVHPGLQARLFLATFGRLLFSGGLYKKLKYVNRLEFLWDQEVHRIPNEHLEDPCAVMNDRVKGSLKVTRAFGAGFLKQVRRNEVEVPEFVYDHDEDLEYCLMMDYGLESDHPRLYAAPSSASASMVDSPAVSMYSMRCIA